jgi:hypothetical protein
LGLANPKVPGAAAFNMPFLICRFESGVCRLSPRGRLLVSSRFARELAKQRLERFCVIILAFFGSTTLLGACMKIVTDRFRICLFLIAVASAPALTQTGNRPPSTLDKVDPTFAKTVSAFGPLFSLPPHAHISPYSSYLCNLFIFHDLSSLYAEVLVAGGHFQNLLGAG